MEESSQAVGARVDRGVRPLAQKLALRVLEVVEDGPAHCYDVADELGIDMKTASATLSDLHADGLLIRRHKVRPAGRERECWVYERPNVRAKPDPTAART